VVEAGHAAGLTAEVGHRFGRAQPLGIQQLDRHRALQFGVVDGPLAAPAYLGVVRLDAGAFGTLTIPHCCVFSCGENWRLTTRLEDVPVQVRQEMAASATEEPLEVSALKGFLGGDGADAAGVVFDAEGGFRQG
jgi:hypothetical protein